MKKLIVFAALCLPLMFSGCKSGQSAKPLTGEENGHEWVDLGLSVKWASCNAGAKAPEEPGNFAAWGETTLQKKEFSWATYQFCTDGDNEKLTKYNQNKYFGKTDKRTVLLRDDDLASRQWGHSWRIPTRENWEELCEKCNWEWKGNGYKVTGPSKQSIFLPAAGCCKEAAEDSGVKGYYWTSTLDTKQPTKARYAGFSEEGYIDGSFSRCAGLSIRPVLVEEEL